MSMFMPHSNEALDLDEWRRPRSESSTGADEVNAHFAVSYLDRHYPQHKLVKIFFTFSNIILSNYTIIRIQKIHKILKISRHVE